MTAFAKLWSKHLGALVLVGFALGIATGLFFGEMASVLNDIGRIYIRLLQMAVIPYIAVSLVSGLGRLTPAKALTLARWGLIVLFSITGIAMALMLMAPLGYPNWDSASYFSSSLLNTEEAVDFVSLYIAANPFHALANAMVPAIVLFSLIMGTAVMVSEKKQPLLDVLASLDEALLNITRFVVRLAPIGIFAITANAAGILAIGDLERLQVYLFSYITLWSIFFFFLLPGLLIAFTPVTYRELFREFRIVFITAFVTGSVLVVLPMIISRMSRILEAHGLGDEDTEAAVDVLVPTVYNFPSVAMLLVLSFVLFAGWYSGSPIGASQYPQLAIVGSFVAFGGANIALPFLLDMFRLPADMMDMFLVANVVNNFFFTALSTMSISVVVLLTVFLVRGQGKFLPGYVLAFLAIAFIGTPMLLKSQAVLIDRAIEYNYDGYEQFISRSLLPHSTVIREGSYEAPGDGAVYEGDRLQRIAEDGVIRVGFASDALPWIFRNDNGDLVGFDMEWLVGFAEDLETSLEMVRIEESEITRAIRSGQIDLFVSGQISDPSHAGLVTLSQPYSQVTLGVLVPDHRRDEFSNLNDIVLRTDLTVGVTQSASLERSLKNLYPNLDVVFQSSPRSFLEGNAPEIDTIVIPAETASAWTLIYPDYSVVIPREAGTGLPVVAVLPSNDPEFRLFLNSWLQLADSIGVMDDAYMHWILGEQPESNEPRWSIIRDVLHWVE